MGTCLAMKNQSLWSGFKDQLPLKQYTQKWFLCMYHLAVVVEGI